MNATKQEIIRITKQTAAIRQINKELVEELAAIDKEFKQKGTK